MAIESVNPRHALGPVAQRLSDRLFTIMFDSQLTSNQPVDTWRVQALATEILEIAQELAALLKLSENRLIHREQVSRVLERLQSDTVTASMLRDAAAELTQVVENASFPPSDQQQDAGVSPTQRTLARLLDTFQNGERNRLRATLRQLRIKRAQAAEREKEGFTPDELKLIASLSERLTQSWPFRAAFVAAVTAAAFAITGTVVIGGKSYDFLKDIETRRQVVQDKAAEFNKEALTQTSQLTLKAKDFEDKSDALQREIVNLVVARMTAKIDEKEGELNQKLVTDTEAEVAAAGKIRTLEADVAARKIDMVGLDGLKTIAQRTTDNAAAATTAIARINELAVGAAVESSQVTARLHQVDTDADRIAEQAAKAAGLGERIGALQQALPPLEDKVHALKSDADTARPVLVSLVKIGDVEAEAGRLRDTAAGAAQAATASNGVAAANAGLTEAAKRHAEQDTAEIARIRHDAETPAPTPPSIVTPPSEDPRIAGLATRLDTLERMVNAWQIERPVNLSYLQADDCRRVQQALLDVGTLRPPPPNPKKKVAASPVDGNCGSGTNAAALAWQIREQRTIVPARTADEIVQTLRAPRPGASVSKL